MDETGARGIERVVGALARARHVAVITGAGISAESGVPTFRGRATGTQEQSLWSRYSPEQLATPGAFARDPVLVWNWYRWRRSVIAGVRPNPGHFALARLEDRFETFTLLTQNIDGLHRLAGSRNVVELHGNIWRARCTSEPGRVVDQRSDTDSEAVPTCACGSPMRPDIVWFGEALDAAAVDQAVGAVRACDVLLVVGTSAVVYPVAGLPALARRGQALVVEVNVDNTPLTRTVDVVLRGPSGIVLPEVERRL